MRLHALLLYDRNVVSSSDDDSRIYEAVEIQKHSYFVKRVNPAFVQLPKIEINFPEPIGRNAVFKHRDGLYGFTDEFVSRSDRGAHHLLRFARNCVVPELAAQTIDLVCDALKNSGHGWLGGLDACDILVYPMTPISEDRELEYRLGKVQQLLEPCDCDDYSTTDFSLLFSNTKIP